MHNDPLGTPQALTDESGTVVWKADYDPFGKATVNEDPDGDGNRVTLSIRFPGQYYDQETGLHYNYFRYYDPSIGRYLTSDPIGLVGGINTYVYTLNNPLYWIDPTGLDVTINLYPGAGGFGHIGAGVNSPNTSGFYPAPGSSKKDIILGNDVPGELLPDTRTPIDSVTIPTTPEQDRLIQDLLNQRRNNPGNYNLYNRNCTTTVNEALGAAGISCPDTIRPRRLFNNIQSGQCQ